MDIYSKIDLTIKDKELVSYYQFSHQHLLRIKDAEKYKGKTEYFIDSQLCLRILCKFAA